MQATEHLGQQPDIRISEARTTEMQDVLSRYLPSLHKRACRYLGNEADAEDILQDVFYQLLGNKEPIDQVASWLFTVARNKIIDSKRKKLPLATDFLFSNVPCCALTVEEKNSQTA